MKGGGCVMNNFPIIKNSSVSDHIMSSLDLILYIFMYRPRLMPMWMLYWLKEGNCLKSKFL